MYAPPMGLPPPVTIAVVSWNTRDLLAECLRSLRPEVEAGRVEPWVVDNASEDGSATLVRKEFPWAKLIASERNLGFGPAVNLVAERSQGEWIAPANADVELTPGALEALLEAGARHPRAGAVAPRLLLPDGSAQVSARAFPTPALAGLLALGAHRFSRRLGDRLYVPGSWDPHRPRWIDWALGAFLLVRRAAWDQVGGFDPRQWMYAEDLDLGWRLAHAGWRTWYEPTAVLRHHKSAATAQAWGRARRERWIKANYDWMRRRRGRVRTSAYAVNTVIGAVARLALLTPAAWVRPAKYGTPRTELTQWTRLQFQYGLGVSPADRWRSLHRGGRALRGRPRPPQSDEQPRVTRSSSV
jgi:N-acetylglucosaminyl-diphospho-decaprenol L-rhamnosyltransferase